jgi:AcrR family transcriptional regulator
MRATPKSPAEIHADGRTRRKFAAMQRVQAAALDLFEARGFDSVTIEEIALAAEVGPATVYRNFGGKERIVLWDDYDPMLLQTLAQELATGDLIDGVLRALARSLSVVLDDDRARILRRARLIQRTPALQMATASDQRLLRAALADVLIATKRARDPLEARVWAGAMVTALDSGVEHWLAQAGREPLARCFTMAFRRLRRLAAGD